MLYQIIITKEMVKKHVEKRIKGQYWDIECGIGEAQIDDVVELFLDRLNNSDGKWLDRYIEDMLDMVDSEDIISLHKRQNRYKPEEWIEPTYDE
jgi:peptidyl-tRNA hydrolase